MSTDNEPVSTDDAVAEAMRAALAQHVAEEPVPAITWTTVMAKARRLVIVRRLVAAGACVLVVLGATTLAVANTSGKQRRGVSVIGSTTTPATSTTSTPTTTTTTPACTHLPIEHVDSSYYGLKAPNGPSIDFQHSGGLTPVIDKRGNRARTRGLTVQRIGPDGTVTLTLGSGAAVVLDGFGDFDGDGRGDLLVLTVERDGIYRNYIVPGSVAPGTYQPAAVGVAIPNPAPRGELSVEPASIGDQDLDGADDISFGQRLYSGRELAALAPGELLPAPFRTLPSQYVGLLKVDANHPPSFVLPAPFGLDVLDSRSDRLLFEAGANMTEALRNGARAGGWLVNGKHIVNFEYSTRGGGFIWRWNLDGPCGTR
jgi:hypothetical protein